MKHVFSTLLAALIAGSCSAGIVFEIETRDFQTKPPRLERTLVYAEGLRLKLDNVESQRSISDSMIFLGDRHEMLVVDHRRQTYMVVNQRFAENIAGQLGQMAGQVQGELDSVPPDQRSMLDQMMKNAPQQKGQFARPHIQVTNTGKKTQVYGYPCVLFRATSDGRTIRDVWVTDWANIQGGRDLAATFSSMSEFFQQLMAVIPFGAAAPMDDNAFATLKQMGGFPVATREYRDDGSVASDSALRSATNQSIKLADFRPPSTYQQESMPGGPPSIDRSSSAAGRYGQGRRQ